MLTNCHICLVTSTSIRRKNVSNKVLSNKAFNLKVNIPRVTIIVQIYIAGDRYKGSVQGWISAMKPIPAWLQYILFNLQHNLLTKYLKLLGAISCATIMHIVTNITRYKKESRDFFFTYNISLAKYMNTWSSDRSWFQQENLWYKSNSNTEILMFTNDAQFTDLAY